jgi:16S rRNA (guanine527-N7)-methyltransferase
MANIWLETLNWIPTEQQQEQFQRFYELIVEGNRQLNLTRITEPQEFWEKHLWDSLRGIAFLLRQTDTEQPSLTSPTPPHSLTPSLPHSLTPLLLCSPTPSSPLTFIDIGTGAGFPGIPVAMAVNNCFVSLLDSTRKKIAFLDKTIAALDIKNVKTITGRSEEIGKQPQHRQTYDIALIRAVGTTCVCAEYALPLVKQGGLAVIYRGNWTQEEAVALENAVKQLGGKIEEVEEFTTPLTNSIRHCVYLRKIKPTPAQFPRAVGIPSQQPL